MGYQGVLHRYNTKQIVVVAYIGIQVWQGTWGNTQGSETTVCLIRTGENASPQRSQHRETTLPNQGCTNRQQVMSSFRRSVFARGSWPHLARHGSCFSHFQFDTSVKAIHYRSLSSVITYIIPTTSFWIITPRIVIKVVFGLDREYIHNWFRSL